MPAETIRSLNSLTEEAVLTEKFEIMRPRLMAFVKRRLTGKLVKRIDPEGLIQEAFLRVHDRWSGRADERINLTGLIYRKVLDVMAESVRRECGPEHDVAREVSGPRGSSAGLADLIVDRRTGPTTALSRAERRAMVRAALERLREKDRTILELRFFEELGAEEIAEILQLSRDNVYQRIWRAMQKLGDLIPPEHRPEGRARR